MITNLNSELNISDGSSRGAEMMEVDILTLPLATTTVNYINVPLPSGNETRAYKWQMDPEAPNLSRDERRRIRKAISDKERRDKEKLKIVLAEKMVEQKNDTIAKLSDQVSRLEQDFRQFFALNTILLERKRNKGDSLMDNAVSASLVDLLDYSTTLLVNPSTLEPPEVTNNSSEPIFSDDSSSVMGMVEVETFPLSPSPTTVSESDNKTPFGNGTRQNGRAFKWTMNPDEPCLKIEQKRSILKAKSCRGQREKEKLKYLQLQELVKQKDDRIRHLLRKITQLEGDNERLSTNNIILLENEREESSNNNHNDRGIGLVDTENAVLTCALDMESLY